MTFGDKIKQLRLEHGWSQYKLAKIAGVPRASLASIETNRSMPKTGMFLKLASAFDIPVEELYEAAGYEVGEKAERHVETLEAVTEKLLLTQPVSIPVYMRIQPPQSEAREGPVMHIYRIREKAVGRNIEAYIVRGQHLKLDISDGDIVLVDRDLHGEAGDVVLCLVGEETILGRLVLEENVLWLVVNKRKIKFEDCQISTKVIEVRKHIEKII